MRILAIVEYVREGGWRVDRWAPVVTRSLAGRGHEVILACDGGHDLEVFGASRVVARNPRRTRTGSRPFALRAWVERVRREESPDVTLSLSPIVPGDVWAPVGLGPLGDAADVLRTMSPVSALVELLHRPWLLQATWLARTAWSRSGVRARLGVTQAFGADGWVALGAGSALDRPDDVSLQRLRVLTRSVLGIAEDARCILFSGVHPARPGLASALAGAGRACERGGAVTVLAGRSAMSIRRSCPGVERWARFVGHTTRMEALLAACDVAAIPGADPRAWSTGRFAADALRVGRPIVGTPASPGVDLGAPHARQIIPTDDADSWALGFEEMLSATRLSAATRAARERGREVGVDRVIDRLEELLRSACGHGALPSVGAGQDRAARAALG